MMMKKIKYRKIMFAMCILIIFISPVILFMLIHPLARPSSIIRRDMFRHTPIGTHASDVMRFIDHNPNWQRTRLNENRGVRFAPNTGRRRVPSIGFHFSNPDFPDIGSQSLRVSLGYYIIVLRIFVSVHYAFDEDGYLIDIFISRELDLM